uniref:TRPM2 chanzyme n=1 Tax=Salpingoeca rosetta (strain ATCC 50818 / BSB-021) TaxID=946362 RepID=UPI0031F5DB14
MQRARPGELVEVIMFRPTGKARVSNLDESMAMEFTDLRTRAMSSAAMIRQSVAAKTLLIENEDGKGSTRMEVQDFMKRFHMHASEDDKTGSPSTAWGTLRFPTKEATAPYLRLSVNDDPEDALLFVKAMLAQKYGETYDRPSLILSVTGGARNFTLPPRLETAIAKGLRLAAQRTNAWVVTGGTNTGVMKLTGQIMEALSKTQSHFIPPTIGIATYGVIIGGDDMTRGEPPKIGLEYEMHKKDPPKTTPLDDNHNLFLLVDDGSTNKFGKEIKFRAAFENAAGQAFAAPVVTIVVQGGPGTLGTALQAVRQGTPIVVVDGSGLAADVLAYAYNFMHNPLTRFKSYTIDDLRQKVAQTFNPKSSQQLTNLLDSALECVQDPNLVVVYSLQESGIDEFDDCILKAIFSSQGKLGNKLKQAMYFDQLDVAKRALSEASKNGQHNEIAACINDNLMAAMMHNKPHFVELYLGFDAKIYELKPSEEVAKTNITALDELPSFALAIEELYKREAKKPHSHVQRLVSLSNTDVLGRHYRVSTQRGDGTTRRIGRDLANTRAYNVLRMDQIFARLVSKDFSVNRDFTIYDSKYDKVPGIQFRRTAQASHMLFLWAICLDRFRMARHFWLIGDQSIINALVASRILERLSTHRALQGPHLAEERAKMQHNAKKFEELAVGVLGECHGSDSHMASEMLHSKNDMFNKKNAINIAYDAKSLAFLSHPATQSVINADWYGHLKSVTSFWAVLFAFFFPFFVLPFINFSEDHAEQQVEAPRDFFTDAPRSSHSANSTTSGAHRLRRKFAKFYSAPYTRFISDLLSHFVLCVVTSYFVLDKLEDTISAIEWILLVWFVALLLEELRQMIFCDGIAEYISDTWNRLDLIMITLFFVGFFTHASDPSNQDSKVVSKGIHAFLVVVLWLRFMRYYALSKNLGPKLIMMMEMMKDVSTFVFLLLIFLIGYGVAAQSLLSPDEDFSSRTFIGVLFRPYFQIYGELFLDDLNSEANCLGDTPFTECSRETVRMVPFFLAVYILGSNVLLVNLLIAMFNDTYMKVQEAAEDLWRKQNYELCAEYKDRPFLPAPFILLAHVHMLFMRLLRLCGVHTQEHEKIQDDETKRKITTFEALNTDKFLRRWERERQEMLEARVKMTNDNVVQAMGMMDQLLEHMISFRFSLDQQATKIKQEIRDDGLPSTEPTGLVSRTPSQPINRLNSAVAVHGHTAEAAEWYVPPEEYPKSGGVKRYLIDASMVPLSIMCPSYDPVEYTHPSVAAQPVWADPADPRKIKFNVKDEVNGKVVDRTSCHPSGISIDSNTGRPINPWGRTGMTGRGLLGKWGVNQAADTVVTRWKRSPDGSILERDGKKVLEFVAIQRQDNKMWAIPGGFVDNGEDVALTSGREFMEEALGMGTSADLMSAESKDSLAALFSSGTIVARIYCEDPRNTDNAWVETTCVNFHDESGRHAARLKLQGGDDAEHARWMMVHGGLNLFASHRTLLQHVTSALNAYF